MPHSKRDMSSTTTPPTQTMAFQPKKEACHGKSRSCVAENLATDLSPDFPRKFKPFPSCTRTAPGATSGGSSDGLHTAPGNASRQARTGLGEDAGTGSCDRGPDPSGPRSCFVNV